MYSLLSQDLDKSVEGGLQFANLLLVPHGYADFQDFSQKCQKNRHLCACTNDFQRYGIYSHCDSCSNDRLSCVCLDCFFKGDHSGHNFYFLQSKDPICDCGQSYSMKPESFCSDHQGNIDEPEKNLLTDDQIKKTVPVLKIVVNHLISIFPANESAKILEWLETLIKFGDGYIRLIVNAFEERMTELFHKILSAEQAIIPSVASLFFKLLADHKFKTLFSLSLIEIFPRIKTIFKSKSQKKTSAFHSAKSFFYLAIRPFSYPKLANSIILSDFMLPEIFNSTISIIHFNLKHLRQTRGWDSALFKSFFSFSTLRVLYLLEHPKNSKDWVFNSEKSRNSFFDLTLNCHYQIPTTRRTEEHVLHEDTSTLSLFNYLISLQELTCYFIIGYKLLKYDISIDNYHSIIDDEFQFNDTLNENDIDQLISIISQVKELIENWQNQQHIPEILNSVLNHKVKALNPLVNEFSVSLPLHLLFHQLLATLIYFYKLPFDFIIKKLKIDSLLPFLLYPLETYSASLMAQSRVFVRNSDSLITILGNLSLDSPYPEFIFSLCGLSQVCLATEINFESFLATIVHSFGLTNWMTNFVADESLDISSLVSLLCRFFIIIFSNQPSISYGPLKDYVKFRIKHSIWTKTESALKLKDYYPMNLRKYVHPILNEVAFKIKDQFKAKDDEGLTPFYLFYLNQTFFDAISHCLKKNPKEILPLPESETTIPVFKIVESHEFYRFMKTLCFNIYTLKNSTASHCFIALLRMCITCEPMKYNDEKRYNCGEFIQKLFSNEDERPSIMKMLSLMELPEFPSFASLITDILPEMKSEIDSLLPSKENIVKKKPNKDLILAQFQNQMNDFAELNKESLENDLLEDNDENDENESDAICAFCKMKMKYNVDDYGIFSFLYKSTYNESTDIASPIFTYCNHFAHKKCYHVGEPCPLCRTHSTSMFPISGKVKVPSQTVFNLADSLIRRIELMSRMKNEINQTDKIVARSAVLLLRNNGTVDENPFHKFLVNSNPSEFLSSFEKIPKSAIRKVNIVLDIMNLPKIDDISEVDDLELPFGIEKLPNEFYKLFLKDGVPDPSLKDHGQICQCLLCGERFPVFRVDLHTRIECPYNFGLFLVINGKASSAVFFSGRGRPILWGSIYLTELGCTDIGLTSMEPLYLSKEQVQKLQYELFSGKLLMKSKISRPAGLNADIPMDAFVMLQNMEMARYT
ncbi:hypothetical protein TRFO_20611 [Tritrichomonas foetus]|uniref:E3 ubiquitin-protein ligase n=1 Tax=Tritrichomonas foetus TaxID=1144522 RepID=A0A1J4KG16_9EUKA|nr:hypothetical protein TRFO_20611 [Tritrichomonas foetus]|eukprot:OHT10155.1 hypothetical protein TRFO_20611 [Tritrichomonas foetus]